MTPDKFKFGTCTVPDGRKGAWSISTFTLTADDVLMPNLRALRDGNAYLQLHPGDYRRLCHDQRGVVMSNTPMEIHTAYDAYTNATGVVLINGLGLGMVLEGILAKPAVTSVTVIELDQDVCDLVGPHYLKDSRVQIICADAYTYKPDRAASFDYVWHDIWDDLDSDNLPLMAKLNRKYARKAAQQGTWSRAEVRREKRRWD